MFKCPVADCDKSYGYESTLRHHIKIKHQGVEPESKLDHFEGGKTVPQLLLQEGDEENDADAEAALEGFEAPFECHKLS